eukprot:TRINITY_DN11824_c0_g2_i4.p1 TRINITY_DN11824_c0_g2~~TRINITY_DN11824_c0_g2_i4.p1  ORF type:complete len:251 (-),score=17.81 TRINITY_DN11824_c0_g2_i4:154-906(-)
MGHRKRNIDRSVFRMNPQKKTRVPEKAPRPNMNVNKSLIISKMPLTGKGQMTLKAAQTASKPSRFSNCLYQDQRSHGSNGKRLFSAASGSRQSKECFFDSGFARALEGMGGAPLNRKVLFVKTLPAGISHCQDGRALTSGVNNPAMTVANISFHNHCEFTQQGVSALAIKGSGNRARGSLRMGKWSCREGADKTPAQRRTTTRDEHKLKQQRRPESSSSHKSQYKGSFSQNQSNLELQRLHNNHCCNADN